MKRILIALIKCFPNISSLYLCEIVFICDCNQWSDICVDCSYQCFDVLSKFVYLKKLKIFLCNFRIRCQSLEKFVKLCRIVYYSEDFDLKELVENVIQFCEKRPKTMFYLQLRTTPEEIIEMYPNIPKSLCLQNII